MDDARAVGRPSAQHSLNNNNNTIKHTRHELDGWYCESVMLCCPSSTIYYPALLSTHHHHLILDFRLSTLMCDEFHGLGGGGDV